MISLAASAARTSCTSESRLIVSFPVLWPARSVREGEVCARQSPARRSRTSGRGNDRVQGYRQDKCGLGGLVRSRVGVTCRAPRGPGRPGAKSPTPGLRLVRSLRTTSSGPSRALRPAGAIKGQLSRSVTPQTLRDRKQLLRPVWICHRVPPALARFSVALLRRQARASDLRSMTSEWLTPPALEMTQPV